MWYYRITEKGGEQAMEERRQLTSRLTAKYQATIPGAVRRVLGLKQGDQVVFEIRGGQVMVRRAIPEDAEYLRALEPTLTEWQSPEDEAAFGGL